MYHAAEPARPANRLEPTLALPRSISVLRINVQLLAAALLGEVVRSGSSTTVRLGGVNLTAEPPPFVNVAGSYDVRSADPRRRRAFIRLESRL